MEYKDQLNRTLYFPKTPTRIVSLVPSQTELLVDLGLREYLVGITKFCVHPQDLRKDIKVVGGTKKVNFEKIEALSPDIIICNKEENTKEMVERLSQIAPVWVSDIYDIPDSLEMIEKLSQIFKVEKIGSKLIQKIQLSYDSFKNFVEEIPNIKVLYLIWKNPYMAAGNNTFINSLLELNKMENVLKADDGRYPEVDEKKFQKADIILFSSEPYPFKEKDMMEISEKYTKKTILVDGEFFSWYGTRLILAFNYFKSLHRTLNHLD